MARKIPIEVFKTRNNGWGARCPVRILRGTVLGFYTGYVESTFSFAIGEWLDFNLLQESYVSALCPVSCERLTEWTFRKRKRLASLTPDEREYSFDLDIRDDEAGLEAYSVCAYYEGEKENNCDIKYSNFCQGNWTRFVK